MPIRYRIDHPRRLVAAAGFGTITDEDVFGYQTSVWSRGDVAGYEELIDFTAVEHIVPPPVERVQELATLSASMESSHSSSRMAIVAPSDVAYGLGRMFQAFRSLADDDTRKVDVFRTREEARAFLELDEFPMIADESEANASSSAPERGGAK